MGELLQPWHLLLLAFIACIFLIPVILCLLTLMKTLSKCAPSSRTMEPSLVWLSLVPLVNLVFNFFIVLAMAKSLRNEFTRRGIPIADAEPGQGIGLAMCVCSCCGLIPLLGLVASLASLVLWIMYWVKIAEYSRLLDMPVQTGIQS